MQSPISENKMYSFCVEDQKGFAYHLEGLRVPLVVRVPQFGNHWLMLMQWSTAILIKYSCWGYKSVVIGNVHSYTFLSSCSYRLQYLRVSVTYCYSSLRNWANHDRYTCDAALPRNCVDHPADCNLFKTITLLNSQYFGHQLYTTI